MAKLPQSFVKYLIKAKFEASGIVERPDVIGAIFGQTEGLLGDELDLRELQRTGRIGRIEVTVQSKNGKSFGEITIPSSLDMSETALIASALETIEKIGPCDAKVRVESVEDVRSQKRRYIIERAKQILREMIEKTREETRELSEVIKEAVRAYELTSYRNLPCGPGIYESDEIIIVEGRADVINLLKHGIKNAIAIEGNTIPQAIIELSRKKITTAFVDGDRGGELILRKLLELADIDYVARAPEGKEVEELTKKEIFKALRSRVPADQVKGKEIASEAKNSLEKAVEKTLREIFGSRAAVLIDKSGSVIARIPLSQLSVAIHDFPRAYALVVDCNLTQELVDLASRAGIKVLACNSAGEVNPRGLKIITRV